MNPITTLLIANRGEISCRISRTARDMGIRTVAVYVEADTAALHVKQADDAVLLAGGSYLDGAAVLAACEATGANAVHPGYGFLSENAGFAQSVLDAGLIWVGPPPAAVAAMGDKLAAKRLAVTAGVPTLPSSDDPTNADSVGYPLLVKAAAGGGGKGMRVVNAPDELADAVAAAQREALSGFGDSRVFLERYVARSRHVEIQILGDTHGTVVHLGERECSIQRRHQKVIEESPSPVVDATMRAEMGAAAIALAEQLGYYSAGTVEFLVDDAPDASGRRPFWFLEVNTRLQVEHPVTELVTGLNLVREQLLVAMGMPLGFGQNSVVFTGHAIEARLYAEDAVAGFLPATGTLHAFEPATTPTVRWDSGVEAGSIVTTNFDPMLAKVIAHGPTRADAALRLALALERTHIAGVTTNRDVLVSTLRHTAFLAGDTTTDFFERHDPDRSRPLAHDTKRRAGIGAALWLQGNNRADAPVLNQLTTGWRNSRMPDQKTTFAIDDEEVTVSYHARRDGSFLVDGTTVTRLISWTPGGVDAEVGGRRIRARITATGDRLVVNDGAGDIDLRVVPRFSLPGDTPTPGGLTAPMPGRVLNVLIEVGDSVTRGQVLMILEAMKMEHRITAPADGVVMSIPAVSGDQVQLGAVLVTLAVRTSG